MSKTRVVMFILLLVGLITPGAIWAGALVPVVDSIAPITGSSGSSTDVTITGSNFDLDAKVHLLVGGSYDTPGNARGIYVVGNYAYVADGSSGLQIIDISDPSSPALIGSHPAIAPLGVYVSGNYAYLAMATTYGLQAVDISDPSSPTLAGNISLPDMAYGVYVDGNYAYVADAWKGFYVINVSDPSSLTIIGSNPGPDNAFGVYISGNYAHVAAGDIGLYVINITNPSTPTYEGKYNTPGDAYGVYVSGNYAYVADGNSGLQVIDISNPASPTLAGNFDTPGSAQGVYVSGNFAYVADGNSGLQVIAINPPVMNITIVDSNTITATVPAGYLPGLYDVQITNPGGEEGYLSDSFTIVQSGGDNATFNCFIATAAYGSYMEPQVRTLRQFRDSYLLTNKLGTKFVKAYYTYSPPMADYIAEHDGLRGIIRIGLAPLVGFSWLAVNYGIMIALTASLSILATIIGWSSLMVKRKEAS